MKITNCVLCKQEVVTSNCLDGICRICWSKINDGDDVTFKAYMELNVFLEAFPKQKGRYLT